MRRAYSCTRLPTPSPCGSASARRSRQVIAIRSRAAEPGAPENPSERRFEVPFEPLDSNARRTLPARLSRGFRGARVVARVPVFRAWRAPEEGAQRIFRWISHRSRKPSVPSARTPGMRCVRFYRTGKFRLVSTPGYRGRIAVAPDGGVHRMADASSAAIRIVRRSGIRLDPPFLDARMAPSKTATLFQEFFHRDARVAGAQRPSAETYLRIGGRNALKSRQCPGAGSALLRTCWPGRGVDPTEMEVIPNSVKTFQNAY